MHVVKHHSDLFSWEKYNNFTHMSILHEYRCKDVIECGVEFFIKSTMFLLCWPLTLLCHAVNEWGVFLAHVSSIAGRSLLMFLKDQGGQGLARVARPTHTFSWATSLYFRIQAIPQLSVGHIYSESKLFMNS